MQVNQTLGDRYKNGRASVETLPESRFTEDNEASIPAIADELGNLSSKELALKKPKINVNIAPQEFDHM